MFGALSQRRRAACHGSVSTHAVHECVSVNFGDNARDRPQTPRTKKEHTPRFQKGGKAIAWVPHLHGGRRRLTDYSKGNGTHRTVSRDR